MLALGLGIEQVDDVLPAIAYAFLSGLNAAIVGIIALAAVQLSSRSVKSTLDRILIVFGGCAGVCYSSLWYFPVIIVSGGLITLSWNYVLAPVFIKVQRRRQSRKAAFEEPEKVVEDGDGRKPEVEQAVERSGGSIANEDQTLDTGAQRPTREHALPMDSRADTETYKVPIVTGIALVVLFIGKSTHIIYLLHRSLCFVETKALGYLNNEFDRHLGSIAGDFSSLGKHATSS